MSKSYRIDRRLPGLVYAQASPHSKAGVSIFEADAITVENARDFVSRHGFTENAVAELTSAGFTVLGHTEALINISGPPDLYQSYFRTSLLTEEREVIQPGAVQQRRTRTFLDSAESDVPGLIDVSGTPAARFLEGVAIEQPASTMATKEPDSEGLDPAVPPVLKYSHLQLDRMAELLGATAVHERGITGRGVRLTMVDTGWERHPYFAAQGFVGSVVLGPGAAVADKDEDGHGTGESANAFAVAPGIEFTMVKGDFTNMVGAFNTAVNQSPKPHIISNSWGYDIPYPPLEAIDKALAESIALAVLDGIVVVCSAGNGHHAFPGQHPDVISVGGAYVDDQLQAWASDYASGFSSALYPGRIVPDVSGLVGMQPHAVYIMLPVPKDSVIDRFFAGLPSPDADGTLPNDGWAVASGTSASAPQVAGVCALMLERRPDLTPRQIREALQISAIDVTQGRSNEVTGGIARIGPDNATGYGLVDALAAVALVGPTTVATGA